MLTPLFLLAGTFFPLDRWPEWLQALANLNPLHQTVELVRDAVFDIEPWEDSPGSACSLRTGSSSGGSRSTR